ncbi:MAG TPA: phosphoribosylaminoimidazolesuccinocarboxamide synthase, partial [Rhizobiales bacterium]|nr:phosphoribosylaminoimidazolesuccinocarboxamide synthase [Hyphomicrobiales bacterium]
GEEPESLDKEFLRLWVRGQCDPYKDPIPEIPPETLIEFARKYVALFETVTGQEFEYSDPTIAVRDRVRAALARDFPEYF